AEDTSDGPVRDDRSGGGGRADENGGRQGEARAGRHQAGHLRRTRRRPREREVLPSDRSGVRVLFAVPSADCEIGSSASGVGGCEGKGQVGLRFWILDLRAWAKACTLLLCGR